MDERRDREIHADGKPQAHSAGAGAGPPLPAGFSASGFAGGVKKSGLDMALLFSDRPAVAGGVFTQNIVRADCVERNSELIERGGVFRAICANSGNANACTGLRGAEDSSSLARAASGLLSIEPEEVLLASTGVIGVPLPVDRMLTALGRKEHMPHGEGLTDAAKAIMTTDTVPKVAGTSCRIDGKDVRLAGIAKGSGMIHPNMATMLGFVLSDAEISGSALREAVRRSADRSFNMISVDGDTSTNDMLLVLANGASAAPRIESLSDEAGRSFYRALEELVQELAVSIARDGEGATKLLEVRVEGAADERAAGTLARAVTRSNLVKAAFFGEDANWGRVLAAMGAAGTSFDPSAVHISFSSEGGEVELMRDGSPLEFDEEEAAAVLAEEEIGIRIGLGDGAASATAWGCDLSYEYVKINGDYRT
jgi:glutamate N-acetyltransferase/amino-acid N-acetyltransferase